MAHLELLKKSNHYIRDITAKRVTSGEVHLRGLAPGQHSSEETSQRWRAVGDTVSDLTDPGIEPQISHTDSNVLVSELQPLFPLSKTDRLRSIFCYEIGSKMCVRSGR